MSDEFNDVYDTEDEFTNEPQESTGPKPLREALKREREGRLAAEAALAAREEADRQSKLVEALNSAGVNPVVADLIPKDADPGEWLAKYGAAFGQPAQEEEPEPIPEAAAQLAAVSGSPGGPSASSTPTTLGEVATQLDQFKTKDELMAYLRQNATHYK